MLYFFISIIEKYFPKDLEKILNMVWYWDEAIFEWYLIEQLDDYNISYSKHIKEIFIIKLKLD